ncbi:hypothetical protein Bca4012_058511 [Brassica carinata]
MIKGSGRVSRPRSSRSASWELDLPLQRFSSVLTSWSEGSLFASVCAQVDEVVSQLYVCGFVCAAKIWSGFLNLVHLFSGCSVSPTFAFPRGAYEIGSGYEDRDKALPLTSPQFLSNYISNDLVVSDPSSIVWFCALCRIDYGFVEVTGISTIPIRRSTKSIVQSLRLGEY